MNSELSFAQRAARRAKRLEKMRAAIKEAVADVNSAWHGQSHDASKQKISGHPGSAATLFVSDVLAEYHFDGERKHRYVGMDRQAGAGAHGIIDGTITVLAEFRPYQGPATVVEVPVVVKGGYMLRPGLLKHDGVPYVLAQSTIDELTSGSRIRQDEASDRKHIFDLPDFGR
jgi:hypothetical protein